MNGDTNMVAPSVLVVTGSDTSNYSLAQDMAASFRANYGKLYGLAFLNFSSAELPPELKSLFDTTLDVSGDLEAFKKAEGYYISFSAAKARLPELFPGYDIYCWIDADCWFQGSESMPRILQGAGGADIAIHPEYDPHYFKLQTPSARNIKIYQRNEGKLDKELLSRAMFNSGVYAMKKDSKVWALWREALETLRRRHEAGERVFFSDQIPLHRLLHTEAVSIFPLRAIDNWQTYASIPLIDWKAKLLRVPT